MQVLGLCLLIADVSVVDIVDNRTASLSGPAGNVVRVIKEWLMQVAVSWGLSQYDIPQTDPHIC